jgi:uracil-DNA glycosylase family 4
MSKTATGRLAAPRHATVLLAAAREAIVACERCSRLRQHCQRIGSEKRRAYSRETYWARPVPGFGDPGARLLIVGLAPAAHGANRTGRVFTGDGKGGSGDFLMAALHRTGFANQPTSTDAGDGLRLLDAFITMAVRCAPPDNTPTREEAQNCLPHLDAEVAVLPKVVVVVALGAIGFGAYLRLLRARGAIARPAPAFEHGAAHRLPTGVTLLGCYHPSRQNTNTGRLTPAMMIDVFEDARRRIRESAARSILPSAPPSAPSTDRGGRR